MQIPQEWFTLAILATTMGAASALRLFVEYTKPIFDSLWLKVFKVKPKTFVYSLAIAYFIVYGVTALTGTLTVGAAFANIFNGPLLAILAKAMVNENKQ